MKIIINENAVLKGLLFAFVCLFTLNFTVHFAWAVYGKDSLLGFTRLFNFYEEANLPTWYTSLLLSISACFLAVIAVAEQNKKEKRYWFLLAMIFVFLSIDETAKVHELIGGILSNTGVQRLLPTEDSSSWVFYGGVMCFLVVVAFLRFWLRLESRIRTLFFASAVLYVGGALGFELIEIYYIPHYGVDLGFYMLSTAEESLEMLGVLLFIYALMIRLKCNIS